MTEELIAKIEKDFEEINALKVETEKKVYKLVKSDGLKLHHAGYFLDLGNKLKFGQLFYSFSIVENKEKPEEVERKIIPYIIEIEYENGHISKTEIKPLSEVDFIDLGETIAEIEKKTLGVSSLPTQLSLDIITKVYENKLPNNPIEELRKTYKKVKEKLLKHVYHSNETIIDIALCWAFATYWNEIFGVMPILELVGVSGSGKTRFGTALTFISKKGLGIADPTDANLVRVIDGFKPTLLIDDWDEIMRSNRKVAHSLLKHVYKQSIHVPRLTQYGKRFYVEMFSPYAPLIITTCEPISEPQLQRRIVELHCEKSTKQFPALTNPENYFFFYFKEERDKLYEIMFSIVPNVYETFINLNIELPSPYSEIWSPILTIAKLVDEDIYKRILEYAKQIVEEKESEVYREEILVLQAIEKLFEENKQKTLNENKALEFRINDLQLKLKELLLSEEAISEKDFEKSFSSQRLGIILNRLGIKKKRKGKKRERIRIITEEEFIELCKKLGYEISNNETQKADEADKADDFLTQQANIKDSKNASESQKEQFYEESKTPQHAEKLSASSALSAYPILSTSLSNNETEINLNDKQQNKNLNIDNFNLTPLHVEILKFLEIKPDSISLFNFISNIERGTELFAELIENGYVEINKNGYSLTLKGKVYLEKLKK